MHAQLARSLVKAECFRIRKGTHAYVGISRVLIYARLIYSMEKPCFAETGVRTMDAIKDKQQVVFWNIDDLASKAAELFSGICVRRIAHCVVILASDVGHHPHAAKIP